MKKIFSGAILLFSMLFLLSSFAGVEKSEGLGSLKFGTELSAISSTPGFENAVPSVIITKEGDTINVIRVPQYSIMKLLTVNKLELRFFKGKLYKITCDYNEDVAKVLDAKYGASKTPVKGEGGFYGNTAKYGTPESVGAIITSEFLTCYSSGNIISNKGYIDVVDYSVYKELFLDKELADKERALKI
ncbi:hypothetical protein [Flavobacterium laiguense]|nr:hypothetical protein [Flavobacterium laiguense]